MLSLSIDQIDIVGIYSVDYAAFGLPWRRRRASASNSVSAAARKKGKVLMIGANFGWSVGLSSMQLSPSSKKEREEEEERRAGRGARRWWKERTRRSNGINREKWGKSSFAPICVTQAKAANWVILCGARLLGGYQLIWHQPDVQSLALGDNGPVPCLPVSPIIAVLVHTATGTLAANSHFPKLHSIHWFGQGNLHGPSHWVATERLSMIFARFNLFVK